MDKLKKNLNTFYGAAFEGIARDFLIQKLELKEAMRQWGKIQGAEKGKNTYEIDLIAKNSKQFFVFEFKWKKLSEKSALKVLKEVEIKANYLQKKLFGEEEKIVFNSVEIAEKIWLEINDFVKEENLSLSLNLNVEEIFLHNLLHCTELVSRLK